MCFMACFQEWNLHSAGLGHSASALFLPPSQVTTFQINRSRIAKQTQIDRNNRSLRYATSSFYVKIEILEMEFLYF